MPCRIISTRARLVRRSAGTSELSEQTRQSHLGAAHSRSADGADRIGGTYAKAAFGTRLFWITPGLRALLALDLAVATAGAIVFVNTVVIVRDHFDRPAGAVSLALAAYGAGSILTALALPRLLRRFNDRTVMLLAAFALSLILAAVAVLTARTPSTGTWAAALAACAAIGAASSAVLTPGGGVIRRSANDADLPAAFAAQFSLSHTSPSRHTGTCAFGFAAVDTDDASSAGPCAGITRSVRA
ncbi:hypothetical protein [Streptomyces sp. MCL20-2]|uniref:hypothetical protein n=1 Tax=Streptomyces sp. MCL20-2 TaxID=2967219 RepID=UPI0029663FD9|nr:hypothetical protein [Streptomyces sp. MCL20-2]